MICACGSKKDEKLCCEPYLSQQKAPATAEILMRSRYTAYTKAAIEYIKRTMRGPALDDFDETGAFQWAKQTVWINLTVLKTWQESSQKAYVEFIVTYIDNQYLQKLHEISEFIYEDNQWFYYNGIIKPQKNSFSPKISLNTTCPCGSKLKFKQCHGKSKI